MQAPVTVLNMQAKRETGKNAQLGNILAAKVCYDLPCKSTALEVTAERQPQKAKPCLPGAYSIGQERSALFPGVQIRDFWGLYFVFRNFKSALWAFDRQHALLDETEVKDL